MRRVLTLAAAAALFAASAAGAQRADSAIVSGRVTSEGGVPIPSAVVTIPGARASTQTNDAGNFRLALPRAREPRRQRARHTARISPCG